jgi:hypothetical protein
MKSFIVAAGLLVMGATSAVAQFYPAAPPGPPRYDRGVHRYDERFHDVCHRKSFRLHEFERRSARDGRITRDEARTIRDLERDLRRTCGGLRYRG